MDSYIVRVYRRSDETGREVSGLVERIGNGGRRAFSNGDELWRFITGEARREKGTRNAPMVRRKVKRPG